MTFKTKNKNRNLFNSKKTIDAINIDILKDFESNQNNLTNYKTELSNKNKKINKLKIVSVAKIFGEAVNRVHNGESVSALFES